MLSAFFDLHVVHEHRVGRQLDQGESLVFPGLPVWWIAPVESASQAPHVQQLPYHALAKWFDETETDLGILHDHVIVSTFLVHMDHQTPEVCAGLWPPLAHLVVVELSLQREELCDQTTQFFSHLFRS